MKRQLRAEAYGFAGQYSPFIYIRAVSGATRKQAAKIGLGGAHGCVHTLTRPWACEQTTGL